jgi:subfamily B ATP-binding cassette protein MsbA
LLVKTALTDSSIGLVKEVVRIVALLGTALWLDPALASISFIVFPLCIIPIIKFGRRVKKLSRTAQDLFGGLTAILHEMIVGHKVVQAFTMENHENQRFRKENRAATRNFEKAAKYDALGGPTNEVLASLAIAGIILYGGHSVISGVRTQGDFIAFITAMFLLYEPLKRLGRLNNSIQTGFAAAERIFEVIDETPDIVDCENAIELDAARPRIEFKDVWFSYDPLRSDKTEFALKDVSLKIEPGQTIALVGMSGGGKSTLVNLLPRFYDPTKGSVSINGIDIKQLSLASLRKNIAIVSQHTFLFNDSVAHNIGYGRFQATRDEVIAAAKAANAHDFIIKLPNGYDTFVGEQGLSLSGGERARIAIARALLKNAPILILDEATASLDSESEELVQIAIDRLMNGRTVLVIAHRLATVRGADKILALSNGRIVESGNHQQLLASDGEYAKLYRIQFGAKSEHDKLIAQG